METLVTIHSWVRWLVLVALVVGVVLGFMRYRAGAEWTPQIYKIVVMTVDIQVLIGLIVWLFNSGWDLGFFFAILHPVAMLLALAVAHGTAVIAKRQASVRSWLISSAGSMAALILIVGAIPWDRL